MHFEEYVKEKLALLDKKMDSILCLDKEVAILKVKLSGNNKQLKVIWTVILLIVGAFITMALKK